MQYYSYLIAIAKPPSSKNHHITSLDKRKRLKMTNFIPQIWPKTDTLFVVNNLLCQIHNKTNDEMFTMVTRKEVFSGA